MTRPARRSLPIAAILFAACSGTPVPAERTEGFGLQLRESAITARFEGVNLQATFELAPTTARPRAGELIVELRPLGDLGDGEPLASGSALQLGSVHATFFGPEDFVRYLRTELG